MSAIRNAAVAAGLLLFASGTPAVGRTLIPALGFETLVLAAAGSEAPVRLTGHTVPLSGAIASGHAPPATLSLTLTLRRNDEAGFQQYLHDVYDPRSPIFRHFLTQAQIAERFGPSKEDYEQVAAYLSGRNLATVERAANRLTITVNGTRNDAERALGVHIGSYAIGTQEFFANDRDPALPPALADRVQAISGLSNLAQPHALNQTLPPGDFSCPNNVSAEDCNLYGPICELYSATKATGELLQSIGSAGAGARDLIVAFNSYSLNLRLYFEDCLTGNFDAPVHKTPTRNAPTAAVPWKNVDGSNQTIGIVAFDNFQTYDIANYLSLTGAAAAQINNLSVVNVGAGASFGAAESEVVLDIDTVMTLAPNANVIVYSSAFPGSGSSFQGVFNKMLSDGLVTIVSNSWAYCENQTSLADVQSIDTILQSAAVAGISVFSASGDSGSTCLDGSANTVSVPADVPHITAVGGTTLNAGAGGVYQSETWWNGASHTPPTGQGGFGVSQFFSRPSYQNGLTAATMRSIPDVAAPADPVNGLQICQTDAGGCPTGLLYGGTSMSAPIWAAFTALLNQAHGSNLGFLNPQLYPLSASTAFHNAASMGSNFAHVGLGSPNLNALSLQLAGQSAGVADASQSEVLPTASPTAQFASVPGVPADGSSAAVVVVTLRDANGNTVPGKTVSLQGNAGHHATITPASGLSSMNGGTVSFTVTDLTSETVTFKATDTTDAVIITQQPSMAFVTPPAAFASIMASPTTQVSDGASTSTVTVTLEDVLHRPTAGKQVLLNQNHHSVIVSANPATSDAGGHAQFQVADSIAEAEHYDAVDQTDGDLPVPFGANVTFTGTSTACARGPAPIAGLGYRIDVYASGFAVLNGTSYGGITINDCVGVGGIAFDGAGNMFASDYVSGDVYKFPPGGGIAGAGTKLANNVGIGLAELAYGTDGNLYGARVATSGNYTTGAVVKINQSTGAATTVASSLTCPNNMATNPLNSDLFVANFCQGAAADSAVLRIASPGVTPVVSTYANSEAAPNGSVSVAPDGTLYVVSNYVFGSGSIDEIAGTDQPQPPAVTPTGVYSTYSAVAFGSNPDGGAQAMITSTFNTGGFANSVAVWDMTATPPAYSGATLVARDIGAVKVLDASGCLYLSDANIIYKVSNADGSCPLAGLAPNPSAVLVPETEPAFAPQGTAERFDLTFPHSTVTPGTPVIFTVSGSNTLQGQVLVGLDGRAVLTYAGAHSGNDTITAYTTINGTLVASNPVLFRWNENKHVSGITLNTSVASASLGSRVTVSATILDVSLISPAPIQNLTIQFTMGGQTCSGVSNAAGLASCSLTVSALTQCTLTAAFAGNATYLPSTASELFSVSRYDVVFANGFEAPLFGGGCVVY